MIVMLMKKFRNNRRNPILGRAVVLETEMFIFSFEHDLILIVLNTVLFISPHLQNKSICFVFFPEELVIHHNIKVHCPMLFN